MNVSRVRALFLVVLIAGLLAIGVTLFEASDPNEPTAHAVETGLDQRLDLPALTVDTPPETESAESQSASGPFERAPVASAETDSAEPASGTPSNPGEIHGRVLMMNRRPVPGARVRLDRVERRSDLPRGGARLEIASTVSDDQGCFQFLALNLDPLSQEFLVLVAQHDPLESGELTVSTSGVAREGRSVAVILGSSGRLKGVVTDTREQWIAGATIEITSAVREFATSGSDGRFDSGPIAPGYRIVVARADGYAVSAPAQVSVTAGNWSELRFRLRDGGALSGIVVDDRGRPLPTAKLHIQGESSVRAVDALGRFDYRDVARGRASIQVNAPGFQSERMTDVMVPSSALRVTLRSGWMIEGVVVDRSDRSRAVSPSLALEWASERTKGWPSAGSERIEICSGSVPWVSQRQVTGRFPDQVIGPELDLKEGIDAVHLAKSNETDVSVIVDPNGRFRCYGTKPGILLIVARDATRGFAVGGPFVVGPKRSLPELTIEFPRTVDLSIRVSDAATKQPLQGVLVWHGPMLAPEAASRMIRTDASGLARLLDVPDRPTYLHASRAGFLGHLRMWNGRAAADETLEIELDSKPRSEPARRTR